MPERFLKIAFSQVMALIITTPVAAQSATPAAFFRKGPAFEQRVEQRLSDHEQRLTRLEVVSTPRRSKAEGQGKAPVRSVPARTAPAPTRASPTAAATHTVRAGETPSSIARKHKVSVAQLMKSNGLSSGSVIRPGQKLAVPGPGKAKTTPSSTSVAAPSPTPKRTTPPAKTGSAMGKYTVKRGETVRGLASRFGLSEKEFMRLNGLKDATKLRAGALVKFPVEAQVAAADDAPAEEAAAPAAATLPSGWRWHTVERGESLSQVAARHGHDRSSLEQANALQAGAVIHEGVRLKIPPPGVTLEPPVPENTSRPASGADHSVLAYQVQKGDTLEKLSETFATTPAILRKLNRLAPGDTLASGNRIVVPNTLFE